MRIRAISVLVALAVGVATLGAPVAAAASTAPDSPAVGTVLTPAQTGTTDPAQWGGWSYPWPNQWGGPWGGGYGAGLGSQSLGGWSGQWGGWWGPIGWGLQYSGYSGYGGYPGFGGIPYGGGGIPFVGTVGIGF